MTGIKKGKGRVKPQSPCGAPACMKNYLISFVRNSEEGYHEKPSPKNAMQMQSITILSFAPSSYHLQNTDCDRT